MKVLVVLKEQPAWWCGAHLTSALSEKNLRWLLHARK